MAWGTTGAVAGIQAGPFMWLKRDIARLSIVERGVSYLRSRLDGPPDTSRTQRSVTP